MQRFFGLRLLDIFQAIDIMLTCSAYRFVPYVRYGVAFNYLLIISSNSPNLSEIDLWQFKFVISHVLHNCFDKEKYASIALDEFIENIHKNEFEKRCLKIYKSTIFLLKHQM